MIPAPFRPYVVIGVVLLVGAGVIWVDHRAYERGRTETIAELADAAKDISDASYEIQREAKEQLAEADAKAAAATDGVIRETKIYYRDRPAVRCLPDDRVPTVNSGRRAILGAPAPGDAGSVPGGGKAEGPPRSADPAGARGVDGARRQG